MQAILPRIAPQRVAALLRDPCDDKPGAHGLCAGLWHSWQNGVEYNDYRWVGLADTDSHVQFWPFGVAAYDQAPTV